MSPTSKGSSSTGTTHRSKRCLFSILRTSQTSRILESAAMTVSLSNPHGNFHHTCYLGLYPTSHQEGGERQCFCLSPPSWWTVSVALINARPASGSSHPPITTVPEPGVGVQAGLQDLTGRNSIASAPT